MENGPRDYRCCRYRH